MTKANFLRLCESIREIERMIKEAKEKKNAT